jgi:hypothetical protein
LDGQATIVSRVQVSNGQVFALQVSGDGGRLHLIRALGLYLSCCDSLVRHEYRLINDVVAVEDGEQANQEPQDDHADSREPLAPSELNVLLEHFFFMIDHFVLDVSYSIFLFSTSIFPGVLFALIKLISFVDSYHSWALNAHYILVFIFLLMVLILMLVMMFVFIVMLFLVVVTMVLFLLSLVIFMTFITIRRGARARTARVLIVIAFRFRLSFTSFPFILLLLMLFTFLFVLVVFVLVRMDESSVRIILLIRLQE